MLTCVSGISSVGFGRADTIEGGLLSTSIVSKSDEEGWAIDTSGLSTSIAVPKSIAVTIRVRCT